MMEVINSNKSKNGITLICKAYLLFCVCVWKRKHHCNVIPRFPHINFSMFPAPIPRNPLVYFLLKPNMSFLT